MTQHMKTVSLSERRVTSQEQQAAEAAIPDDIHAVAYRAVLKAWNDALVTNDTEAFSAVEEAMLDFEELHPASVSLVRASVGIGPVENEAEEDA